MADEATTHAKEQVCIIIRTARQSVKHKAINSDGDGSREGRLFIKCNPVGVVIVGHDLLTTQTPSTNPFLYSTGSVKDVSLPI
jgi:hypothetical protein